MTKMSSSMGGLPVEDRPPGRVLLGVVEANAEVAVRPVHQLFELTLAGQVAAVDDAAEERRQLGAGRLHEQDARAVRADRVGVAHLARGPAELARAQVD